MIFSLPALRNIFLTLTIIVSLFVGSKALASTGDNVTGFAWSANIGWISFNCTSQPGGCTATPGGFEGGGGDIPDADEDDVGFIGRSNTDDIFAIDTTTVFGGLLSKIVQTLSSAFPAGLLNTAPAFADDVGAYGSSYGVSVDPVTGNFSGYAWSPYVGWISFNEYAGCPEGSCAPHLAIDTGKITGWAKALSATGTSGWDGWISLSCTNTSFICSGYLGAAPSYGLTYNNATKIVSGYAWGDDVVGWMSFDGPTYEVMIDLDQPLVSLTSNAPTFCPDTTTTLTWSAVGEGLTCTATSTNADPAFTGPIATSGTAVVSPSAPSTTYTISCIAPGSDTNYQSSVTVALGDCGSDLILSAEPAPAQCTAGYRTNFTLYSPSSTAYLSCTPLTPTPMGATTPFTSSPNAGNGYLVTLSDVLVPYNPTSFSTTCYEPDGTPGTLLDNPSTIATTSVARACALPYCEFTSSVASGDPLTTDLVWTSTGASSLTASGGVGGWTGPKAFVGSQNNVAFDEPQTTYFLTATNPDGLTHTCKAVVDTNWCDTHPTDEACIEGPTCIDPDPNDPNGEECDTEAVVTITADPTALGEGGGSTVLEWESSGITPDTCVAYSWPTNAGWNGAKEDDGANSISLIVSTNFRVQCEDGYDGSIVQDDVMVTVDGTPLACDTDPETPNPDCPCTDPLVCPLVRTKPWYIER